MTHWMERHFRLLRIEGRAIFPPARTSFMRMAMWLGESSFMATRTRSLWPQITAITNTSSSLATSLPARGRCAGCQPHLHLDELAAIPHPPLVIRGVRPDVAAD